MSIWECVGCSGTTKAGRPCKRRTCMYADRCFQHTAQRDHLRVATSGIPDSGYGLYTLNTIPNGGFVAKYEGKRISEAAYNLNPSRYGIRYKRGVVIDAASTQSSLARYANKCKQSDSKAGYCSYNSKFAPDYQRNRMSIRATKIIPAGSEVFVPYGGRGF